MGLSTLRVGTTLYFDYHTKNISGASVNADATPKYWVYRNAESTGVIAAYQGATLVSRGTFPGAYFGTVVLSTGNGFSPGNYYNITVSGTVNTITTYQHVHTFYTETNSFDTLSYAASSVYYANINHVIDDINNRDEYTVLWFKDDTLVTGYPAATIQVMKRDGNNLIPATGMSSVGANTAVKFDTTSAAQRIIDGEGYIVITSITYDGSTRTWRKIIGNDVNTA